MLAAVFAVLLAVDAGPAPEIRYLALGDSFTIGTGSRPNEAFPSRLAERWKKRGARVVLLNPAVNGYSTRELLEDELPKVKPFQPTIVTLAIGANDLVRGNSLAGYRKNLKRIFKELKDAGVEGGLVYAIPQPDWSQSPTGAAFGEPSEIHAQIVAFNQVLAEETKAAGGTYVDFWPTMQKQGRAKQFAPDGLHPSAGALNEWAEILEAKLPGPHARVP